MKRALVGLILATFAGVACGSDGGPTNPPSATSDGEATNPPSTTVSPGSSAVRLALEDHGITAPDTAGIDSLADQICAAREAGDSFDGTVANVADSTGLTLSDAQFTTRLLASAYCPESEDAAGGDYAVTP